MRDPEKIQRKQSEGPRTAPVTEHSLTQQAMNNAGKKTLALFRKEFPLAMQKVDETSKTQSKVSCTPYILGKATRSPFNAANIKRYELLKAVSTDSTGLISLPDI